MKKKVLTKKNSLYNIALCLIAFLLTVSLIVLGTDNGYTLTVGSVSPERFVATREVINSVATEKKITDARESVAPYYTHDPKVEENAIGQIEIFFDALSQKIEEENDMEENDDNEQREEKSTQSSIHVSLRNYDIYKALNEDSKIEFKDSIMNIARNTFEQGVKEDTETKSYLYIQDEVNKLNFSEDLKKMAFNIIISVLRPNMIVDEDATEKAREQKAQEVIPTTIKKNQKIVDKNEIITEEIYAILNSLNIISTADKTNYFPVVGAIMITGFLFISIAIYLQAFFKNILKDRKETLLLFILYSIILCIMRLFRDFEYHLIPISLFSMLFAVLLNARLSVVMNMAIVVIGAMICGKEQEFIMYYFITGTFSALLIHYTYKRNMIIIIGVLIGVINAAVTIGISLYYEGVTSELLTRVTFSALIGLFSVIGTIGSLPFWEGVFEIITPVRLQDLTNPDNELLRRLMIEAPGTYHHSLVVANLAETAAFDINANSFLARAGAYYHDIGKLKFPGYFSENLGGENPHEFMEAHNSAYVIFQHVANGIEMAAKYNLPKAVADMIPQHHGTTVVKYFYYKAMKGSAKESVKEEDFRYKGIIPQTKEAAIIMLADTAEAAVRAMVSQGKRIEEVNDSIKALIKDKLDDGQLDDSGLTINNLETIRKSFMKVFKGMYHERVQYPQQEADNKKTDESGVNSEPLSEEKKEDATGDL